MLHAWERKVYEVLMENLEGKKPLGRTRRRWDQNVSWGDWLGVDWIRLAQDRDRWRGVVNAVMNLRVLAPRS
jgi:hypothetical protein